MADCSNHPNREATHQLVRPEGYRPVYEPVPLCKACADALAEFDPGSADLIVEVNDAG